LTPTPPRYSLPSKREKPASQKYGGCHDADTKSRALEQCPRNNDGLVYVCDRINDRIQVFKKDGTFVKEWFYEKNTLGNGAVWDIAIWPDPKQTYLLSADGENNEIRVLKREDGTVVGSFGRNGRNAGQFHWVHAMAVDAQGNVYTAEVDTGKRIQKFKLTSDALR
jgi:DNA-binding beta-propeller fold protein YncE